MLLKYTEEGNHREPHSYGKSGGSIGGSPVIKGWNFPVSGGYHSGSGSKESGGSTSEAEALHDTDVSGLARKMI